MFKHIPTFEKPVSCANVSNDFI